MLLVNGGLAVLNGLLVATGKIWCECFRGGTCCGGECRCDEGYCCDDVWHTDLDPDEPCAEGQVFILWGPQQACCGCLPEQIFDGRVQELVNTADLVDDLCCPNCTGVGLFPFSNIDGHLIGCAGRCCDDVSCSNTLQGDCPAVWYESSCCEDLGCPRSCCTEDAGGVSQCDTVDELLCTGVVDTEPCETACKGACCVDDELVEGSPKTQLECDEVNGCWYGAGSTECGTEGFCRAPFNNDCCETVESSAELLTFTGPRKLRCPELAVCGVQVTVEVTTRAPIFVHGGLFGSGPYDLCTDETTFTLCNDQFHITPANPCSGNLQEINVKACWDDDDEPSELLRFRCCQNITHLIGNCDCDCVTTVLYEGGECTSNAEFVMRGDAIIDASGTGPLVLTEDITHELECARKLTLQGSNTDDNLFSGEITDGPGTSVDKRGLGSWRLNAPSDYSGKLRIMSGTFVVDANIDVISGGGPFGTATGAALRPEIGEDGTATLLLVGGREIDRGFSVVAGNGVVTIGMIGSGTAVFGGSMTVRLARDITLQAVDSGTVEFQNGWKDIAGGPNPAFAYNIGSAGNAGTVILGSFLPDTITEVNVHFGTLKLDGGTETIGRDTPVTLGLGSTAVTLDLNGTTQPLASLTFEGANGSTVIGPGTLQMVNAAEIQVTSSGSGTTPEISANVELADPTDVTVLDPGVLTISGVVSGTASLTLNGSGTLILSGANTYTGTTTVSGGTLEVTGSLADTTVVTVEDGATYKVASTDTVGSVSGGGNIEIGGGAIVTVGGLNTTTEHSGVISGFGGFAKTGSGTLTLSGANTYTGTTTVSGGTLVLSGTLAATSQISIGTATLESTGSTKSADAVEITGTATLKGAMTVGTLSGSGSLTHDGGTLTLTNASTLTGTLTVASGSLVLNAIVSGGSVTSATLTPSALTVDFSSIPSSGSQFVLLAGATGGTYSTVALTNAGGATGTYNSATSTLTID